MVTAEAPNGIKGARTIDFNNYIIFIVQGSAYIDNKELFLDIATPIQAEVFHRDPLLARRYLMENLAEDEVAEEGQATMMLARPKDGPPGEYVGFALQREMHLQTSQGEKNLLYGARTLRVGHRGLHTGRFIAQQGLVLHRDVDMVGYRTRNPASVWSYDQAGIIKEHFPFGNKLYNTNPLAAEVANMLWWRVRRHGQRINPVTGVSIADFGQEEPIFEVDPNHEPTQRIDDYMRNRLRMNFPRGDSVIAVGFV